MTTASAIPALDQASFCTALGDGQLPILVLFGDG